MKSVRLGLDFGADREQIPQKVFFVTFLALVLSTTCFAQSKPMSNEQFAKLLAKAENGSLSAQVRVAKAYESGQDGKVDYEQAAHWFQKAADQGDPEAQNNLAILYSSGRGIARDPAQAERWFQRSAASGFPVALHNLAIMYLGGLGVRTDNERGIELLTRAANAGLDFSQMQLGQEYLYGNRVPQNAELGFKWLNQAARHHLPAAEFALGAAYEGGLAGNPDFERAFEHYREAADRGYAKAQNNLGSLYLAGKGVQKNLHEARQLFLASAQQGNPQSYFNMALCELQGAVGPVDPVAAYAWYLTGAEVTKPVPASYQARFTQVAAQLTAEQIRNAQLISQNWIAQHPASDPNLPVQLDHVPGAAVAANRTPATPRNQDEVFRNLWQQTPFTPALSPRRPSVR